MRNRFVVYIAGVLRRWRHVCRCHPVVTQQTVRRMFLLDAQSLPGQFPGPNGLASQCGGPGILVPWTRFPYLRPSADGLGASSLGRVGRRGLVRYTRHWRCRRIRQRGRLQVVWTLVVKRTEWGCRRRVLTWMSCPHPTMI